MFAADQPRFAQYRPPADLADWIVAAMSVSLAGGGAAGAAPRGNHFPAMVATVLTVVIHGDVAWPATDDAGGGGHAPELMPQCFVHGPSTAPLISKRMGGLQCVMLMFHPAAVAALIGEGADAIRDRVVPASLLWGSAWSAWEDAIREAPDERTRILLLFDFVRWRIGCAEHRTRQERHWRLARLALAPPPLAARELGLGERQYTRVFVSSLGMRPKLFQRVVRVEAVLRDALVSGQTGPELALRHGFFDQAHMARDVRALAGAPLTRLLHEARRTGSEHWPLNFGMTPPLDAPAGRGRRVI